MRWVQCCLSGYGVFRPHNQLSAEVVKCVKAKVSVPLPSPSSQVEGSPYGGLAYCEQFPRSSVGAGDAGSTLASSSQYRAEVGNTTSADSNSTIVDSNSTSADSNSTIADSNSTIADSNSTIADSNSMIADSNSTSADRNSTYSTSAVDSSSSSYQYWAQVGKASNYWPNYDSFPQASGCPPACYLS